MYATSSTVFSLHSASLFLSDIFVLSSSETWMRHLSKEYMDNRFVRLLKVKYIFCKFEGKQGTALLFLAPGDIRFDENKADDHSFHRQLIFLRKLVYLLALVSAIRKLLLTGKKLRALVTILWV